MAPFSLILRAISGEKWSRTISYRESELKYRNCKRLHFDFSRFAITAIADFNLGNQDVAVKLPVCIAGTLSSFSNLVRLLNRCWARRFFDYGGWPVNTKSIIAFAVANHLRSGRHNQIQKDLFFLISKRLLKTLHPSTFIFPAFKPLSLNTKIPSNKTITVGTNWIWIKLPPAMDVSLPSQWISTRCKSRSN